MMTCGFYLALWARLMEIGVRATFFLFALLCTRLCEEFDEQIEEILENDEMKIQECFDEGFVLKVGEFDSNAEMTKNLELQKWKEHFEKIPSLIENFSYSFGIVALLLSCNDFVIGIFKFTDVIICDEKVERVCSFTHHFFRIFTLLATSNQVRLKVNILSFLFFYLHQGLNQYY